MNQYSLTINPRSKWLERAIEAKVSTRELEILILHTEGRDNEAIADILDIKYQTVKNMLHSLTNKLDANNNAQALMKAISANLIEVTIRQKDEGDLADKIMRIVEREQSKPFPEEEFIINGLRKLFKRKKKDEQ